MADAERDNPNLIMPPPLFPALALGLAALLD